MLQQTDQNLARPKTKISILDPVLGLAGVKVAKSGLRDGGKYHRNNSARCEENRISREQEEERIVQGCLGIDAVGLHASLLLLLIHTGFNLH